MQKKGNSLAGQSLSDLQEAYEALSKRCQVLEGEIIEHKRTEEALRINEEALARRAKEMIALHEVALAINTETDIPVVLNTIVQRATALLETEMGALVLFNPDTKLLEVVTVHNLSKEYVDTVLELGEGVAGRIAQTGEPMMIADYHHWVGQSASFSSEPIGRILGVPLKQGERVMGVLNVFDEKIGEFDEEEIQLLSLFATYAAVVLEKARLFEAERHRAEQLEALHHASQDVTLLQDLDRLLHKIIGRALQLMDRNSGGINLYRPDRQVLEWVVDVNSDLAPIGLTLKHGEGVGGQVWATGQPLIVNDYQNWTGRSSQQIDPSAAVIGVPIQWGDRFLGVLMIVDRSLRPFSAEDATLLSRFAIQAAIAIENARLFEQVQQHNEELEQRVVERTAALKVAQEELINQERLATLGQLTAVVSHELRNPLGTLRASIFTVARKTQDKGLGVERALARIERSITRCDNIITELLDYTRMPELQPERVSFDSWFKEILEAQCLPEGIVLNYELRAGIDISLDLERFRRVIINLFENAYQAMQTNLKLTHQEQVLTVYSQVETGRLKITLVDTGPGIPPDVLPHIFEPLYSTKGFGIGLGLPLVKEIIRQHKGQIEVFSEVRQGTKVILWLPLA